MGRQFGFALPARVFPLEVGAYLLPPVAGFFAVNAELSTLPLLTPDADVTAKDPRIGIACQAVTLVFLVLAPSPIAARIAFSLDASSARAPRPALCVGLLSSSRRETGTILYFEMDPTCVFNSRALRYILDGPIDLHPPDTD